MVQIISDSSTLYSKAEGEAIGLEISPLSIMINGENYREFETITSEELIAKIEKGGIPSSSQPPIGEKINLYNRYGANGEVIDITIAQGLSGTYDTALSAKEICDYAANITVFNSQTLCGPQRTLTDAALKMAKEGMSREAIVKMLEESAKTDVSFLIPFDFAFLQRGGRLSKAAAGLGGLLKLIVCMRKSDDGKTLEKHSINRTLKKAFASIIDELKKREVDETYHFAISHAINPEMADKMKEELLRHYPKADIKIYPLSPAFITQGGPGCCALQAIKIVK